MRNFRPEHTAQAKSSARGDTTRIISDIAAQAILPARSPGLKLSALDPFRQTSTMARDNAILYPPPFKPTLGRIVPDMPAEAGIHNFGRIDPQAVDGRNKPGHDDKRRPMGHSQGPPVLACSTWAKRKYPADAKT
jgi:hypothetical protein